MGTVSIKKMLCVLFSVILVMGLIPSTMYAYAQPVSDEDSGSLTLSDNDYNVSITDIDGDYEGDWSLTSKKSDSDSFGKAVASDAFKDLNGNEDESFLFNVALKDSDGKDISDEFSGSVTLRVDYTASEYTVLGLGSNGEWAKVNDADTSTDDDGSQTSLTFTTDNLTDFMVVVASEEEKADEAATEDEATSDDDEEATSDKEKATSDNDKASSDKSDDTKAASKDKKDSASSDDKSEATDEDDAGIKTLMDGTGSTFPVNTIYGLSVVWTTYSGEETVYSWTRENHVTNENNDDQSTIDALASGSYRVRIDFEDLRGDQDLQVGESYVLALDWPTGEGVEVTPGGTSGTIRNSSGTDLATWELDPETGEITIEILALPGDDNSFYIEFTATVEKTNEDEPGGDNWVATGDIQKDGEIDELVDDEITYTITAVVPRYTVNANGGKAYEWSIDDRMQSDLVYGGDYSNDMSDVEIVLTSTQYPNGIIVPSVENATDEDEYAYYVKQDSDKEDEIVFLNRCTCDESNCANWSDGCGNKYNDTGFCSCWLSVYNAKFTITYSVDISEIIQGMEDHANGTAYTQIMNSAFLYDGPGSIVDNDSDAEYVYRPFTKSETTNPDRNTENKGVGSYEINISDHDVDYSWADDIEITDTMDNLSLVEDSLTVTMEDTVLTRIDEDEAANLDPDTDRDKYYSFTYTDETNAAGETTGGTLVIKIWYPTNQNITIEYQASVISYDTSPTGDYSNAVTIGDVGIIFNGSYQEGSSGEGGSGLTLSMTLTKVDADDNNVVLPDAVFEVYRHVEDGDDILVDTLTTGEDGTFTFASNDEKGYWMDRDVLYYVKEIQAPEGYQLTDTLQGFVFLRNGYEGTYPDGLDPANVKLGEVDGDQIHIELMAENTKAPEPDTTAISGSKTWSDDDDSAGKRPDSITINLFANGEQVDSKTVTADDDWSWTFTDLAKYDEDGNTINYTITEDKVDGYTTTYYDENYNVTNSYAPDKEKGTPEKGNPDKGNPDKGSPTSGGKHAPDSGTHTAKTGDTTPFIALVALAAVAAAIAAVAGRRAYRNRHHGLHRS